jgi:glycosyltransferase involved in cell wall biosynthesis
MTSKSAHADEKEVIGRIASLRRDSKHEEAYLTLKEMKDIQDPGFKDFGYFDELGICCWWLAYEFETKKGQKGPDFKEEGKKAVTQLWEKNISTPEGKARLREHAERLVGNMEFYNFPKEEVSVIATSPEIALVSVAHLLSKEFRVCVYGVETDPVAQYPLSNPRFLKREKFDQSQKYNIVILFGCNGLVETIRAEKKFLWSCNMEKPVDPRFLVFSTGSLWVSPYQMLMATEHKEFMKSEVIPLHLPSHEPIEVPRDVCKCVYIGNNEKEVERLITIWPNVKERVKEATLEVIGDIDELQVARLTSIGASSSKDPERKLEEKALASSGFWINPTVTDYAFSMVSLKAQALGAIPIIVFSGCLKDLVEFGFSSSPEHFEKLLVSSLQGASKLEGHRFRMMNTISEKYSEKTVLAKWKKVLVTPPVKKQ